MFLVTAKVRSTSEHHRSRGGYFDTCNRSNRYYHAFNIDTMNGLKKKSHCLSAINSKGVVTRDDSQRRFLTQHSVATLLRHCFEWSQHCSNIAKLCCAKNRRCESSRVSSPLVVNDTRTVVKGSLFKRYFVYRT